MGSGLRSHWVGSGLQQLKLSRRGHSDLGLGLTSEHGLKVIRPPVAVLKAPVVPVLLVGWLVDPVQLRCLGALLDHRVVLWVARRAKMSSFVSF